MPRNEHFLPRNNGNRSESIPRNFFGTKFRSQPYQRANRVSRGQTKLEEGKLYRQEGEIHGERMRKPCVEKVNHVEVEGGGGGSTLN
jgi:hypothetical protein